MYGNNHKQFVALNLLSSAVHFAIRLTKLLPRYTITNVRIYNLEGRKIHKLERQSFQFTDEIVYPLTVLLVSLIKSQVAHKLHF